MIVGCVGDSGTVCPAQTTSLCTNTAALMCVVSATSTVPCTDNQRVNCVRSEVPCVNNTAPECQESGKGSTVLNIPCISSAKIYGQLTVVNNTILGNGNNLMTNTAMNSNSAPYPVTTTLQSNKVKGQETQNFCVTIVALPAKRKITQGEIAFQGAKDLTSKFLAKVFGS